jgi:hypothetical protein
LLEALQHVMLQAVQLREVRLMVVPA